MVAVDFSPRMLKSRGARRVATFEGQDSDVNE